VSSGSGPASSSSADPPSTSLIAAEVLPPWLECASSMRIAKVLPGFARALGGMVQRANSMRKYELSTRRSLDSRPRALTRVVFYGVYRHAVCPKGFLQGLVRHQYQRNNPVASTKIS
jgi:hypothetical protein